jgi:glutamate formiminotransferase/formiminotetrahydrofolate cyclodeaminase
MNHRDALVECVPNFSEGRDQVTIDAIAAAISGVEGAHLLDVDPGRSTHRTVMTFVGSPAAVTEAAFRAIAAAAERIDMRRHQGAHPRMGATDVCPLVPISGIGMAETAELARGLAERVGRDLGIPVYLYGAAATRPERRQLDAIRAGEYEGLPAKLADPAWRPDYGPAAFQARSGATVIGARDFLVAYNVNLNTQSTRRAFAVAYDVREQGRLKREGHPLTGPVLRDEAGREVWEPGRLKGVKAVGWFIPEYGVAQVSMNITDLRATALHEAFEACRDAARSRGMRATGSELVGLVPLGVLLDAGYFYLRRQNRSLGIPEDEILQLAIKSLGLDELAPFDPQKKVIEYRMRSSAAGGLSQMSLERFSAAVASENPAPGGGSVSAALGALAAALGAMVANVSANKRGWEDRLQGFSDLAESGQRARVRLLALIDEDSEAFDAVLAAQRLPAEGDAAREARDEAMAVALRRAVAVPLSVMREAMALGEMLQSLATEGAPDAVSDAFVGLLCLRAAVRGAGANVRINSAQMAGDREIVAMRLEAEAIEAAAADLELRVQEHVAARSPGW